MESSMAHAWKRKVVLSVLLSLSCWSGRVFALRPFDGTDAAVVESGEFEVELGPLEYLREGSAHSLIAPAVVANYGFAKGWEATIEGMALYGLSVENRRNNLVDNGLFLKHVLREGSLQDKLGPSIATEFGLLLPDLH